MIKMMDFLDAQTLRVFSIIFAAAILWILVQVLTHNIIANVGDARGRRLRTLAGLVKGAASALIMGVATVMVLREVGFDVTPLLASAGILGLAIGFGAQTLVKDVITGFFILIENQFDEGDEIELVGKKGTVKKITLRTVWLEDKQGVIHIVPNSSITLVSNFSKKD